MVDDMYLDLDEFKKYAMFETKLRKLMKEYEELGEAGTLIDYRCPLNGEARGLNEALTKLNEVLTKGINALQSLLALILNFQGWKEVGTFDILKLK